MIQEWLTEKTHVGIAEVDLEQGRAIQAMGRVRIVTASLRGEVAGVFGSVEDAVAGRRADVSLTLRSQGDKVLLEGRSSTESRSNGPCVAALLHEIGGDLSASGTCNEPSWFCELVPDGETDPEEGESIDWWQFGCGFVIGGKRINILPGIVKYLEGQPQDFRDRLLAPTARPVRISLGDGLGTVPVPAKRLHRVLGLVGDLLDGIELGADGGLQIHRLDAQALGRESGIMTQVPQYRFHAEEDMASFAEGSAAEAPQGFLATLRPYQAEGVAWLQFLRERDLGGVLADDMGLGKTVQTLCHLLLENVEGRADLPCLILAPKSVVPNWKAEAAKFAPSLSVLVLDGEARKRRRYHGVLAHADLVVTSYPVLLRDIEVLSQQPFHVVVLDEAQTIKNSRALVTKAVCRLESRHRLCLSGTPIENHLGELWSLLEFLMPGFLGSRDRFEAQYRRPIEKDHDEDRRARLSERVGPLILRRTKDLVAKDLPPKTELIVPIELTDAQIDLYEAVRVSVSRELRDAIADKGWNKSQILVLDALLKLRQICCHPRLLRLPAAEAITESAKLEAFLERVVPLAETGHHILVFSQFAKMLDLLSESLDEAGISHLMLTGATQDRGQLCEQFQSGKYPVFLISLRAGGTGLNLTRADTVIHYDPWWNPALEAQATDRAYRIGQERPVFVHKLVCTGTLEEKIVLLQRKKQALFEGILGGTTSKLDFSEEELGDLLAPVRPEK